MSHNLIEEARRLIDEFVETGSNREENNVSIHDATANKCSSEIDEVNGTFIC